MTFSLVGKCARTGMFGAAVTTSSIGVGSRCPYARAGVGAVICTIPITGLNCSGFTSILCVRVFVCPVCVCACAGPRANTHNYI